MEQIQANGIVITLVHWTYQVNGEWRIACMPQMMEFHRTLYHPNYQRSNDARAVNCRACKSSAEFNKLAETLEAPREASRN